MNAFIILLGVALIFSKREAKKQVLRGKILSAAREVFLEQGYEDTTIGQIAERAGVGLGTAYNYFKSKEELFLLAVADGLGSLEEMEADKEPGAESPAAIISTMVLSHIRRLNFFGKTIWRVTMAAIFTSMKSNPMIMNELIKVDYRLMDKLKSKLETLKEQGRLNETFPIDTAVELIYGAVTLHLVSYIYSDKITLEEACAKIEANIEFVLNNT